jgi:hypothetical protein
MTTTTTDSIRKKCGYDLLRLFQLKRFSRECVRQFHDDFNIHYDHQLNVKWLVWQLRITPKAMIQHRPALRESALCSLEAL